MNMSSNILGYMKGSSWSHKTLQRSIRHDLSVGGMSKVVVKNEGKKEGKKGKW